MSEQESNTGSTEEEDVELHKKKNVMASDEPRDDAETEKDDDVELHGRRKAL